MMKHSRPEISLVCSFHVAYRVLGLLSENKHVYHEIKNLREGLSSFGKFRTTTFP